MAFHLLSSTIEENTVSGPSRRSFLRYTGASAVAGSLWLASCTKKDDPAVVTPPPTIASFTPASGMPGATVTVTGTNLGGTTSLLLGTVATTFTVVNATTVTFTVPAAAQTGALVLTAPGGTATSGGSFTVLPAASTAPAITGFSPTSALPEASVTLTGTNLASVTSLTVNGIATTTLIKLTVNGVTTISFTVPPAATAGAATVVVTGPGGTGTSMGLTVLPSTVSVGTGDAGVLNYAYALEQLEAAFYTQLRTGSYYTGLGSNSAEKLALNDLYYHEVIHRDFLKAAIAAAGATPLKDLTVDFTSIDFSSRSSVLGAARAFEDLGVAAYAGAGQFISSPAYLLIAGKIASVEARHAALIRDMLTENSFVGSDIVDSNSLEMAKVPSVVVAVANTFLAIGSKLDVSGLV
ncbi:ferritin-like domain-containing protein [Hymenobacter bucti]|uniref:Ferritin-like domain-containing protein n=1 Tax=Hymenobacter bucti TaxID=1844114 RepID=A0ABW4QVD7_9BACT